MDSPFQFQSSTLPPRLDPTRLDLLWNLLPWKRDHETRYRETSVRANSRIIIFSPPRPSIRACRRLETIEEGILEK